MLLSKEQHLAICHKLNGRECPICGGKELNVERMTYQLKGLADGLPGAPAGYVVQKNLAACTCKSCGYLMLFGVSEMGIV